VPPTLLELQTFAANYIRDFFFDPCVIRFMDYGTGLYTKHSAKQSFFNPLIVRRTTPPSHPANRDCAAQEYKPDTSPAGADSKWQDFREAFTQTRLHDDPVFALPAP